MQLKTTSVQKRRDAIAVLESEDQRIDALEHLCAELGCEAPCAPAIARRAALSAPEPKPPSGPRVRMPGAPAYDGNRDINGITTALRGQLPALLSCYERALADDPDLSGKLQVFFAIAPQGRVTRLEPERNDLGPELWSCVRRKLAEVRFDRGTKGDEASAEFSFEL